MKSTILGLGALALALSVPAAGLAQVGGLTVLPSGCGTGSLRAGSTQGGTQDTTGRQCASDAATIGGNVKAIGPTANGSPAATAPVLVGGTADGTATGNVGNLKVDSSGNASANVAQVNGVTVLTGSGATGTGSQRVTVAVDSATVAGSASLPAGTNTIGAVLPIPTAVSTNAIAPVVSASVEGTHVFKASAGNLYSAYVTTGATAGFLMIFNATSAPVDGAVTPIHCLGVGINSTVGINFTGPPESYATGISAAFSSTGCFTKTASATAFFHGSVQ